MISMKPRLEKEVNEGGVEVNITKIIVTVQRSLAEIGFQIAVTNHGLSPSIEADIEDCMHISLFIGRQATKMTLKAWKIAVRSQFLLRFSDFFLRQ